MSAPRQITHAIKNWVGTEVSTVSPFNSNNSQLILLGSNPGSVLDHFILCDGDGVFEKDLPIAAWQEPRWSRTEPERLYFIEGNALVSLKVGMPGTVFTEHVFPEYSTIWGHGESDISLDGEHFALSGTRKDDGTDDVFVYNLLTNKKEWLISKVPPFDGLKISSSNEWILSRETDPRNPINDGIFTPHRPILAFNGHACPARSQGQDVLLWCNAAENPVTRPNCPNGLIMVRLSDGYQVPLKSFLPWEYAFHISACDREFCLVSTYSEMNPALPMELWKVPFDGSPETLICTTGGVYRGYSSQPKAALSRDGSRAVYTVDDGTNVNVWMVEIENPVVQPIVTEPTETRIDYAPYVGKSEFVMRPRPDGAVDIFERKL